jgi:hypothetical protein
VYKNHQVKKNSFVFRSVLYAPKVLSMEDGESEESKQAPIENDKENMQEESDESEQTNNKHDQEEDLAQPLMPWRSQLRKTNSTLNLLE